MRDTSCHGVHSITFPGPGERPDGIYRCLDCRHWLDIQRGKIAATYTHKQALAMMRAAKQAEAEA